MVNKIPAQGYNCFFLTSTQLSLAAIKRAITTIDRSTQNTEHDVFNLKLRKLIAHNAALIKPEFKKLLEETKIYVIDTNEALALSLPPNRVVISHRLIELIMTMGFWGNFCYQLPSSFDRVPGPESWHNVHMKDSLITLSYALILQRYTAGEGLPDFRKLQPEESQTQGDAQVAASVAGAMIFILLHEIGHLHLDHGKSVPVKPVESNNFTTDAALTGEQLYELEADNFALSALPDELKKLHDAWINMALSFHLQRETIMAERNTSHPVNISRLVYAQMKTEGDLIAPSEYISHLSKMANSFIETEDNTKAGATDFFDLSGLRNNDDTLRLLRELVPVLEAEGLFINSLFECEGTGQPWHEVLIGL